MKKLPLDSIEEKIVKFNLCVTPVLFEKKWGVGMKILDSDGMTNYIPFEILVKDESLKVAVDKAVELAKEWMAKNKKHKLTKMKG